MMTCFIFILCLWAVLITWLGGAIWNAQGGRDTTAEENVQPKDITYDE